MRVAWIYIEWPRERVSRNFARLPWKVREWWRPTGCLKPACWTPNWNTVKAPKSALIRRKVTHMHASHTTWFINSNLNASGLTSYTNALRLCLKKMMQFPQCAEKMRGRSINDKYGKKMKVEWYDWEYPFYSRFLRPSWELQTSWGCPWAFIWFTNQCSSLPYEQSLWHQSRVIRVVMRSGAYEEKCAFIWVC